MRFGTERAPSPPRQPDADLIVGIIGLGSMGGALADRLLNAGRHMVGYDIERERLDWLGTTGGEPVGSVADLAARAQVVLVALPSADALADVAADLRDSAERPGARPIVVEMSTLGLDAKRAARDLLHGRGIVMLDCPLSGTAIQARRGDLVIYASGDDEAVRACEPVFRILARSTHYLGGFGAGTKTKLIANLLVGIHVAAAAEALVLAGRAELAPEATLEAILDGAGSSRMLEVRGPMMLRREFEPPSMTIGLFQKDLRLIAEFARALGCSIPMLTAAAEQFAAAACAGGEGLDTAAVITAFEPTRGGAREAT